jgi:hypothetical protein
MQRFSVPFDMNHSGEWMLGPARKYVAEKKVDRAKGQHEAEDDCGK